MKIKALTSFTGLETMFAGEVKEVKDEIAEDLIRAGYALEYEADKKGKKTAKKEEGVELTADNGDGTYQGIVDGKETTLEPADEETAEAAKEAFAEEPVEEKKTSKAKK